MDDRWLHEARTLATRAKEGSRLLALASREQKDRALCRLSGLLIEQREQIAAANREDVERAVADGLAAPMVDRLTLTDARIDSVRRALEEVAQLPDPVGEETERWTRPNGMHVARVRIPLGVILMIYESRPNVTVDAAALCIKSGNAAILRGGKEAVRTNEILARLLSQALVESDLPADACVFVRETDRALMLALLQQDELIDLAIPRGGEGLIRFVAANARVPVIKHYKGVCHLYVDSAADVAMAVELAWNGKVTRPSVCNALECLLVHRDIAPRALPAIGRRLADAGVELRADPRARELLAGVPRVVAASPDDFGYEFLDLVLAVKVVDSLDDALAHIAHYGSMHTECIVTEDAKAAERFTRSVEASMVGWNVSTRFNDGGALGLGAEMGISTTKLHAFGPMGLRELTSQKFVVTGHGQVRT